MRTQNTALCLALGIVIGGGCKVYGQGGVQPVRPKVYTWSKPEAGFNYPTTLAPYTISSLVRVSVAVEDSNNQTLGLQASAELTAERVHDEMMALVNSSDPRIQVDPENISVLVQNFGDSYWGGHTKFLHASDAVDVDVNNDDEPDWPDSNNLPEFCAPGNVLACDTDLLQPWMTYGTVNPKQWMQLFLAKLGDLCEVSDVYPSRFDFDTELFLTTLGNGNLSFLLGRMVSDERWDTIDVPGSGQTMKELWQAGRLDRHAAFEANKATIYPNESSILNPWSDAFGPFYLADQSEPFEKKTNRDIFLWVSPIFHRAVDALMDEAAYGPIRDFANVNELSITCSNYGHVWADGLPQRIDWAYDLEDPVSWPCMSSTCGLFPREWVQERAAGIQDFGQHGGITIPLSSGDWLIGGQGTALGESSAPVLYLAGNGKRFTGNTDNRVKVDVDDSYYVDSCRQYDIYRKNVGSTNLPPRDTWWEASLKQHERTLDAITRASIDEGEYNSESATCKISPWLIMPLAKRLEALDSNDTAPLDLILLSEEEFVDQLWLMRRKRVPELLLWDAAGYDDESLVSSHSQVAEAYLRVYTPWMSATINTDKGTLTNSSDSAARLEDSVPRLSGTSTTQEEYKVVHTSEGVTELVNNALSYQQHVVFRTTFNDLTPGYGLKLRIECEAQKTEESEDFPSEYPDLKIYLKNHTLNNWTVMPVDAHEIIVTQQSDPHDYLGNPDGPVMQFIAPVSHPESTRWKSLRRTIQWSHELCQDLISTNGTTEVKVVFATLLPFVTKVDVLQLMNTTDGEVVTNPSNLVIQGADMDYDLEVTQTDIELFFNEYALSGSSADINVDGLVNADDVAEYVEHLANGGW